MGLKSLFSYFAIHSFLFIVIFLFSACVDKEGFINNMKGSNDIHLLSDEILDGKSIGTLEVEGTTTYELDVPIDLDVSLELNDGYQFVYLDFRLWNEKEGSFYVYLAYIIHSGFISGYQNRYGDNLKPPTNVYHRMTA